MSKNYQPPSVALTPAPAPVAVHPNERERIVQLLAARQSERAVDLAKEVHKRCKTTESEELLLDAYGARVSSLRERNLNREASALMDLVRERFPSAGERLREWHVAAQARDGDPSALIAPLSEPSLSPERQAAVAAKVRREVVDLRSLAECTALNADHPLRMAAQALHQAFVAVTSGPVEDASLALPEVPRSSPLSPWKMMVRAIAAYYRMDDALCERCLAAVEPDSAPAGLVAPLRKLLNRPQALTAEAQALVNRVCGDTGTLLEKLKRLDAALRGRKHAEILAAIRDAVGICRVAAPEMLERLRQQISITARDAGVNRDKVVSAIGGVTLKDANFWRLLARSCEEAKAGLPGLGEACAAWEEFRKHAIRERWFPAEGPEVAAIYLRMAGHLARIDPEDLDGIRRNFLRKFDFFRDYYRNQPPVIRILQPAPGNLNFLNLNLLLERACAADPCKENFELWLRHAAEHSEDGGDSAAEAWAAKSKNDVAPLLHLMQSAEKRNALKKAFTLMERAEQIDGLNPEVRRARLRLLVSITLRHLREKKARLAEKDLRQIEALPQAQSGDRPAYMAAMRFVCAMQLGLKQEASAARATVIRIMGSEITAHLLLLEVDRRCGSRTVLDLVKPAIPLYVAWGRVCAACEDVGMPADVLPQVAEVLTKELSKPKISTEPRPLAALGDAAMRQDFGPLAYLIARAGLAQGAENHARFLFLRARALPPWENSRHNRCLAAATTLARQRHDFDLLKKIGEWRKESLDWLDSPGEAKEMDAQEIARLVEQEMKAPMPELPESSEFEDDDDDDVLCECPKCRAEREMLPPGLIELLERMGPDAALEALAEMMGAGKKQRGRRRSLDSDDTPF